MKKVILIFWLLFLLFSSFSSSLCQQKVIFSYDFSSSMKLNKLLSDNDLKKMNEIIFDFLFAQDLKSFRFDKYSIDIDPILMNEVVLSTPIIKQNDIVFFHVIGDGVTSTLISDKSKIFIESLFPNNISSLRYQNTFIAQAKLLAFEEILKDSTTLWILVTDNNKNIGTTNLSKNDAKKLLDLENDIHTQKLIELRFFDHKVNGITLTVEKRKPEYKKLLDIFKHETRALTFKTIQNKNGNQSQMVFKDKSGKELFIIPQKEASENFRNIAIELDLCNKENKCVGQFFVQADKLPVQIDSISFNLPANANLGKEKYFLNGFARYYFKNKLVSQDLFFKRDVEISENGGLWIVILLFLVSLAILLWFFFMRKGLYVGNLGRLFSKAQVYTVFIEKPNKKITSYIKLKIEQKVSFGKSDFKTIEDSDEIIDINAPQYFVKRINQNQLKLFIENKADLLIDYGKAFEIVNKGDEKINVMFYEGELQLEKEPHKNILQGKFSNRN